MANAVTIGNAAASAVPISFARTMAREVVHEMMLTMGVDASKPAGFLEMQKDFQSLREWRNSMDAIRRQGLLTAIEVIVIGILGLVWMSFGKAALTADGFARPGELQFIFNRPALVAGLFI